MQRRSTSSLGETLQIYVGKFTTKFAQQQNRPSNLKLETDVNQKVTYSKAVLSPTE